MASNTARSSASGGAGQPSDSQKPKRKSFELGNGFEEWGGYMNAKKQKLCEQYHTGPRQEGATDIFRGVSIHVNGYTNPSSDELKKLMRLHGGNYQHYMSKTHVTHVIATRLPNSKVSEIKSNDKIVHPDWILESIKAGKLLSYEPYQLYTAQSSIQKGIARFATSALKPQSASETTNSESCKTSPQLGECSSSRAHSSAGDLSVNQFSEQLPCVNLSVDNDNDIPEVENLQEEEEQQQKFNGDTTCKSSTETDKNYHGQARKGSMAGDSTFVSDFYNHSRLHHLSTWKSEFAEYVNHLQASGDGSYPGRDKLMKFSSEKSPASPSRGNEFESRNSMKGKPDRVIMHVDMDCFFVSVGLRERPELKGKPVAVTHSKGKGTKPTPGSNAQLEKAMWGERGKAKHGKTTNHSRSAVTGFDDSPSDNLDDKTDQSPADVLAILTAESHPETKGDFYSMAEIASCSYEARKAGVKNGMFMGGAKKLCPDLVTIPYDFDKYNEVSRQLYAIVASYTHDIEAVSCDEMLVDCTDLLADTGASPLDFATLLRQQIMEQTRCPASVGLGPNILMAKMATRKAKPNGQFHLTPAEVLEFIGPQLVKDLPGTGWATTRRLSAMGITTCADMQKSALATLQKEFGPKTGQSLYIYSRGQDDRPIKVERERKSVSAEINYGIRFTHDREAEQFLTELSEEVQNRLQKIQSKGKSITLKLKVRREDAPVETAKFLGHGIVNNVTKSVTLPLATDNSKIIAKEVIAILKGLKVKTSDLRGIGIQMQKLEPSKPGPRGTDRRTVSILSFAVPKTSPDKSPSVSRGHFEAVSAESVIVSHVQSKISPPKPKEASPEDHGIHEEVSGVSKSDDSEISPSKFIAPLQNQLHTRTSKTRLFQPGHLSEPPLPKLPCITSPEVQKSSLSSMFHTPTRAEPSREPSGEDYLPSPSQIDPEVLKELPADIRNQIETAMKKRKDKKEQTVNHTSIQPIMQEEERAGCSHWPSQTLPSNNPNVIGPDHEQPPEVSSDWSERTANDHIVPLPSPSQIDLDCLHALPEELQKELRQAYAVQKRQEQLTGNQLNQQSTNSSVRKSGWDTIMAAATSSPSKKKSPSKRGRPPNNSKRTSPQFKVPRGRPGKKRKHSPKKLDFTKNAVGRPPEVIHVDTEPEMVAPLPVVEDDVCEIPVSPPPGGSVAEEGEVTAVNLCGRVSLDDVRSLLRQWLQTCSVPEKEDVRVIAEYLGELVLDRNLETVDLVLKFLRRQVWRLGVADWSTALGALISSTQDIIYSQYGSRLKGFPS